MLSSGVHYLAALMKGGTLGPGDEAYLEVADWILIEHERLHADTEIAATRAEVIARRSLYRPYFCDSLAAGHEEALANAQAIRGALVPNEDPLIVRSKVEATMKWQGLGYRDYDRWIQSHAFSFVLERTARYFLKPLPTPTPNAAPSLHTFLFRGAHSYKISVRRVHDLSDGNISILRPFPSALGLQVFVHTNDHPPAHIHIRASNEAGTRYDWRSLQPLKGDSPLSRSSEKALQRYLKDYGEEIGIKVRKAYCNM